MSTFYGKTTSDRLAEENETARALAREISLMGINQRQRLMIIHAIALELENFEHSREITGLVRKLGGDELFLIGAVSTAEEQV